MHKKKQQCECAIRRDHVNVDARTLQLCKVFSNRIEQIASDVQQNRRTLQCSIAPRTPRCTLMTQMHFAPIFRHGSEPPLGMRIELHHSEWILFWCIMFEFGIAKKNSTSSSYCSWLVAGWLVSHCSADLELEAKTMRSRSKHTYSCSNIFKIDDGGCFINDVGVWFRWIIQRSVFDRTTHRH